MSWCHGDHALSQCHSIYIAVPQICKTRLAPSLNKRSQRNPAPSPFTGKAGVGFRYNQVQKITAPTPTSRHLKQ
jgi:hypothetical protein